MISVIVPVYNVAQYLKECVDSILNQTYKEIEVILVDDGSTDNSGEMCDEYGQCYSPVRVIHKSNGGLSSARNAGLDVSIGDYVVFIDSDDYIHQDMLKFLHDTIMGEPEVGIATCLLENFYESGERSRIFRKYKLGRYTSMEYAKLMLCQKVDNAACGKIYRRSIIGESRFKDGIVNEDIIFNLELTLKEFDVVYTDKAYYKYRIRSGSITTKFSPKRFEFINNAIIIREMFTSDYGSEMSEICEGYILKQVADYVALVAKHDVRSEYSEQIRECKQIVSQTGVKGFSNRYWNITDKFKYLLAMYSPRIYYKIINARRKSL